jgi:hypothetical protein
VTSLEQEEIKLERSNMRGQRKERNNKCGTKKRRGGRKWRIYLKYCTVLQAYGSTK